MDARKQHDTEMTLNVTAKWFNEANKRLEAAVRQVDKQHMDGQTDGAGPTSSISWLREGMAGKMQQNVRGWKKKHSELPKSKRKIPRHEQTVRRK